MRKKQTERERGAGQKVEKTGREEYPALTCITLLGE